MRKLLILRNADALARELHAKATRRARMAPVAPPENHSSGQTAASPILEQVTKAKEQAETEAILAALNSTRWNRKQAAALLKIDYKALLYKMKKLGVEGRPAGDLEVLPRRPQGNGQRRNRRIGSGYLGIGTKSPPGTSPPATEPIHSRQPSNRPDKCIVAGWEPQSCPQRRYRHSILGKIRGGTARGGSRGTPPVPALSATNRSLSPRSRPSWTAGRAW